MPSPTTLLLRGKELRASEVWLATPGAQPSPVPLQVALVDASDGFGSDELLCVIVDYHRSPLGAWTATLAPDGLEAVTRQATSAHDAFHAAMDLIEALSQYVTRSAPSVWV